MFASQILMVWIKPKHQITTRMHRVQSMSALWSHVRTCFNSTPPHVSCPPNPFVSKPSITKIDHCYTSPTSPSTSQEITKSLTNIPKSLQAITTTHNNSHSMALGHISHHPHLHHHPMPQTAVVVTPPPRAIMNSLVAFGWLWT